MVTRSEKTTSSKLIYLVSEEKEEAKRIAILLQDKISCFCQIQHAANFRLFSENSARKHFILLDCRVPKYHHYLSWIMKMKQGFLKNNKIFVAFYNCQKNEFDEVYLLEKGFAGFFPESLSTTAFVRGVEAIFSGELFFSRKVLSQQIVRKRQLFEAPNVEFAGLSERERQVLQLLSAGATNIEISESLGISHHTVRTHVFNVYRKINVENRIQATLWLNSNKAGCA